MNALCYKIVFSKRLGSLVAVGEHTTGQGKAAGTGVRTVVFPGVPAASVNNFVGLLKSIFASVALSCVTTSMAMAAGPAANALPTGYSVNSGNVAISSSSSATNAAMTIKQSTDKASINWQSFSIGSGAAVSIQQNSASSVLLNRVVGNDPSQIFGKLTANGQVILINPNGVVFGKGGSVTASAFTASTFGMTDADFNKDKHNFTRNGSTAGVTVEEGATINTTGYVALLGASVDNQGSITTQGGSVMLAAGDSVALPSALTDNISVPLSGKVRLELLPSTINAMVANSGTITTEGGQVLMQAAALSDAVASVTHTGTINTTGVQGGAVTLQADHGIIKATGTIKANSTKDDNKGGDIVIGRDEVTGMLAKSTDVSGATLTTNQGFVETSGDYLATDGVLVKAAEWLLDPSDITISSTANSNVTGVSPADIKPNGGTGSSSIVQVSTITGAINNGTSVTIKTTNDSNTTGAGNITIASALTFSNSTADATLSLIADNGITQNAAISATGSKLVNISMTANGNYQGNTAASANSQGIVLNSTINTNGSVTLNGTNNNTGSGAGVRFANGSGITAASYTVNGTKLGTAGNGYGVWFTGTSTMTSSGASVINGVSNSASGAFTAGLMFDDSTTVTLDAGVGTLVAKGSNAAYQTGVRIAANGNNSTRVTTKGTVTLGSNDAINTGFMLRSGVLTADSGALTILGKTSTGGDGVSFYDATGSVVSNNGASITVNGASTSGKYGVYFGGTSINAGTTGDIAITGNSVGNDGIRNSSNLRLTGKNITLTGTSDTTGQTGKYGILSYLGPGSGNVFTASGNINISGTVTGTGTGGGLYFTTTSWQSLINTMTANGSITFNGTNSASTSNTIEAISLAGVQASAAGDIKLNASTNNAASTAIKISSAGLTSGLGYQGGSSSFVSSGGNVLIQSNQGGIFLGDQNSTTSRAISGKYVFIDNTGGTIDANNVLNTGTGFSTTVSGVQFNDTRAITASALTGNGIQINGVSSSSGPGVNFSNTVALNSPNLLINGVSASNAGVYFGTGATLTSTGTVTATGRSTNGSGLQFSSASLGITAANASLNGASSTGNGIYSNAALNMNVSGTATFNGTSSSTTTQQGGISFQGAVSNASASGGIAITSTDTAGGANWAYYQNGALSSGTGGITINATGSGSNSALGIYGNITSTGSVSLTGNSGVGAGNGIWTSGTVGISGTSVTMNGTGGTTGGAGASLSSGTTVTATTGDVSITGSKPSSTSTAAINFAGTINGVATKNINLTGGLAGAGSILTNGAEVILNNTLSTADVSSVVISGAGSLKNQTGSQALSGTNTYTGITTINSGTLQVGNGGSTGTLGTGSVVDNGALVFNRSGTNTVTGSISGTGTLTQSGSGTTILAADNTYQGLTTVSGGTLQIGNGGSTGTLSNGGAVVLSNGANLNFVRNANTSIDNTISGNGNVNANITGTGSNLTINNSITLSGATGSQTNNAILSTTGSISQAAGKTLGAKNLYMSASNGTIGTSGQRINTSVDTLSLNSAGSQFVTEADAVTVAAKTTANGSVDVLTTGALTVNTVNNINGITANGTGGVKLTGGTNALLGTGVNLSKSVSAGGDIAIDGKSNTVFGVLIGGGTGIYTTNAVGSTSAVTIKGASASNSAVAVIGEVQTNNGSTLRIEGTASNGAKGIYSELTTTGTNYGKIGSATSGAVTLIGTSTGGSDNALGTDAMLNGGYGVLLRGDVTSQGKISITGTSDYQPGVFLQHSTYDYGRTMAQTQPTIQVVSGGAAIADDAIYIQGTNLRGGTVNKNGVLIGSKIINSSNGGATTIFSDKGGVALLTSSTTKSAVTTTGSGAIQNSATAGAINITAGTDANSTASIGDVLANIPVGNNVQTAWTISAASTNITQNSNAGVNLKTTGQGNLTVPKITNNGTGNVTIAAGSAVASGDGSGGQVLTVTGNTITQTNATQGKTYIYTGASNATDALSNLGVFGTDLYLSSIGDNTQNAASNMAYGSSLSNGGSAQVMFREKVALSGALNDAAITYGGSTDSAALKVALQTTNPSTGTQSSITQTSNAGNLKILKSDIVADSTSSMTTAQANANNLSSSGNLNASSTGYAMDLVGSNFKLSGVTANLKVAQKSLSAVYAANSKVFDGSTNAIVASVLKDAIAGDSVASNHTNATFDSADVGTNKTVTVSGITLGGKDAANYKLDPSINAGNKATTKANITAVVPTPPAPSITKNNASSVKISTGLSNPFALASAEDLTDDACSANSVENCHCEESSAGQGIDICYEPRN